MMVSRKTHPLQKLVYLAVVALFLPIWAGCGKSTPQKLEVTEETTPTKPEGTTQTSGSGEESSKEAGTETKPPQVAVAPPSVRLDQTFLEATRRTPPSDQRPPEQTLSGKSVGKLYGEIVRQWDTIRFTTPDGRRIRHKALVSTAEGDIEISLTPEVAPNHVRNFIALARSGYYDGLLFDRIYHEEGKTEEGSILQYEEIEAGCPLGTGDPLTNSIGYWLNPEFSTAATHEEGTVGACRGFEKDTAACKFYITLCKAPYLDGHYTVFGKVTKGLDVARKIYLQPVVLDDADVNGSRRPVKPVVMNKVTIVSEEEPAGKN